MFYVAILESGLGNDPNTNPNKTFYSVYILDIQDNEERDSPPNILASPG